MKIISIASKDLRQIIRDRMSLLFLLIMPLAFTFLMGSLFGGDKQVDNRIPVGYINSDGQGEFSATLISLLSDSESIKFSEVAKADAESAGDLVSSGKMAAVLVIPQGYSQSLLSGEQIMSEVLVNPMSSAGQTALAAIQEAISRLTSAVTMGQISLAEASAQMEIADPAAHIQNTVDTALLAWQDPAISTSAEQVSKESNAGGFSGYVQTSPGMMVQFAIAGLTGGAALLVQERKNRALSRLLTAPVKKYEIILGHVLGMTAVVFLQQLLLILAGQFIFGVNYLRQPLAILIMMIALSLFCACLGLFFGVISKRDEHAIMWPLIAMFILTALGGCWFPLSTTSQTFSTIGHFFPTAWAMDGFQNITLRGLGVSSVLLPALIIFGYALLFFILAVWRMRWE